MSPRTRILLLLALALPLASCAQRSPVAPVATTGAESGKTTPIVDTSEIDRLEKLAAQPDHGVDAYAAHSQRVYVPGASVNAIAAAIAQAGEGGTVVLRKGVHTEDATVVVNQRVTIIGEPDAIVVSGASGPVLAAPFPVRPAFHMRADGATLWGLAIQPAGGDGNTAVLIDGASDVLVFKNRMTGFQNGVVVDQGDRARIWSNTVIGTSLWQTGEVADAYGITIVNGAETSVLRNSADNSIFGIWACDELGTCAFNSARGNFVGIILCKVPAGGLQLPDGRTVGAARSATRWLTTLNRTQDNFTTGLVVIDGANRNLVVSNLSTGNGTYDVEFTTDTYRFGFLTPASFDNTFIAGLYPDTEVKNCGNNNTIIGGRLVDNTLEPCD